MRPPCECLEAERGLLGAVILNPDLLHTTALDPSHFSMPSHQRIYAAIAEVSRKGEVDLTTVGAHLQQLGQLELCGGWEGLSDLISGTCPMTSVEHYAEIIRSRYYRTTLWKAAKKLQDEIASGTHTDAELAELAEAALAPSRRATALAYHTGASLVTAAFDDAASRKKNTGVYPRFGFANLDRDTKPGLMPGCVAVVGARTSVGKTSFLAGVANHNTRRGKRVLFVACEMGALRNFYRIASQDSGVPLSSILNPSELDEDSSEILNKTLLYYQEAENFRLAYNPRPTPEGITALIRRAKADMGGLDLIALDYFQKVRPSKLRGDYFEQRTSVASDLVAMAGSEEVAVLCGCQLNRDAETSAKEDEPKKSELKGTGALEEEATMVVLLHRWDTEKDGQRVIQRSGAGLILSKNQDGPKGKYCVTFEARTAEWREA